MSSRLRIRQALEIVDRLSDAAAGLAILLVSLMICTVLYEVVARHFFNAPTIWSYDVSYMLNGSFFMLGAAYTLKHEGHVRIDFLLEIMPSKVRHILQALFYLGLIGPVMGLGCYFAVTKAISAFERGTLQNASAWEPLIWPFLMGLALGMCLLLLQTIAQALRHLLSISDRNQSPSTST